MSTPEASRPGGTQWSYCTFGTDGPQSQEIGDYPAYFKGGRGLEAVCSVGACPLVEPATTGSCPGLRGAAAGRLRIGAGPVREVLVFGARVKVVF